MSIVELNQKEVSAVTGGCAAFLLISSTTLVGVTASAAICSIAFYELYGKEMFSDDNLAAFLLCIAVGPSAGVPVGAIAFILGEQGSRLINNSIKNLVNIV